MMGTFVEVISTDKKAHPIAFAEISRIEKLLSKYDLKSEVSRLNQYGKLRVSEDTLFLFEKSYEFWQSSLGAFDVSVGPLMDVWGFTGKEYIMPKDAIIKSALRMVGMDKVVIMDKDSTVEFKVHGMKIDLGAIAKGYAVDCAIKKLKRAGVRNCLINAGGDIYCLGYKREGTRLGPWQLIKPESWQVAIKNPSLGSPAEYLKLHDQAVATSGSYEQCFSYKKRKFTHIFDPKTGYPVSSGLLSVTVVAGDCLTADALATAIFVLGKEKGRKLADNFPGVILRFIEA
ncbi:MAG: FAD:protein FMN transferase [Candidatus Omnitrophota bacterium]